MKPYTTKAGTLKRRQGEDIAGRDTGARAGLRIHPGGLCHGSHFFTVPLETFDRTDGSSHESAACYAVQDACASTEPDFELVGSVHATVICCRCAPSDIMGPFATALPIGRQRHTVFGMRRR